jgi:pyruvate/2-oxoglutarate dehydrogenase complex dihydrolipoamide dehydrogenase (E3) component
MSVPAGAGEPICYDVAVVGAGPAGLAAAVTAARSGCRVTLLDAAPRILGGEDEAVSRGMAEAFGRRGIEVVTGIGGVEGVEKEGATLRLLYRRGDGVRSIETGAVVLAVGWPGNLEPLNLPAAGVEARGGYVTVDDALRTSAPHVFAAGDITGRMMLVQSATYEGTLAAENAALGNGRGHRHAIVPHGGFTDPEYAGVGLTEREASGDGCAVATVPYGDLDRGIIDGRSTGSCKLIVSRSTRRVLGAHIVGEQAVEVVQLAAAAMRSGMRVEQLADLELAYPTFTSIIGLAARRVLHELDPDPYRSGGAEWEHGQQDGRGPPQAPG